MERSPSTSSRPKHRTHLSAELNSSSFVLEVTSERECQARYGADPRNQTFLAFSNICKHYNRLNSYFASLKIIVCYLPMPSYSNPRWSGYLACKELTKTSNSGRPRRFCKARVLHKKWPARESCADAPLEPFKGRFTPLQHRKNACDLIVGMVGMSEGFWAGARPGHALQRLFDLSQLKRKRPPAD